MPRSSSSTHLLILTIFFIRRYFRAGWFVFPSVFNPHPSPLISSPTTICRFKRLFAAPFFFSINKCLVFHSKGVPFVAKRKRRQPLQQALPRPQVRKVASLERGTVEWSKSNSLCCRALFFQGGGSSSKTLRCYCVAR